MIIRIFIKSTNGGSLPLNVHNFYSILEVKKMIQDKDGVPVSSQQLVLAGENLEDAHALDDYGIESEGVIDLVTVYETDIKLYITTMTGRSFILQAKSSDSIETIKETISIIIGTIPENQILTSGGKLLAEPGTLADHKIFTDSFVMVTVRLRGSSGTSVLQFDSTRGSNSSLKVTSWDSVTKQLYNLKGVSSGLEKSEFKAVEVRKISSFSQHYKIHGNNSLNMIYHVQGGSSRVENLVAHNETVPVNVGYPTYYNMTENPLNWNQPYTVGSGGNNDPIMSLSGCTITEETDWVTDTL